MAASQPIYPEPSLVIHLLFTVVTFIIKSENLNKKLSRNMNAILLYYLLLFFKCSPSKENKNRNSN